MVHERIVVFSRKELNLEKMEQLFDKIFYNSAWKDYTVDAYSGSIRLYFDDDSRQAYFIQLGSLSESEFYANLSAPSYITIDEVYKEDVDFVEILTYANSLPKTTWIGIMNIAP